MLLSELLKDFSYNNQSFNIDNPDSQKQAISYINRSIKEVWRAAHWNFRKRFSQLILEPYYTTGTCTVTEYDGTNENASRVVTFSGAVLSDSMVGSYLKVGESYTWHKIEYISGNTVYLDTPVISASGVNSFKIWKRFYTLSSDADVLLNFHKWEDGQSVLSKNEYQIHDKYGNIDDIGTPHDFNISGVNQYDDKYYSVGTISGTKNTNVIEGNSTNFLGNVGIGDTIIFDNQEYYIWRVETPTRLILSTYLLNDISAQTSYRVLRNSRINVQFNYVPSDYIAIPYSYLSLAPQLKNPEYDLFPFPEEFEECVLSRAKAMKLKDDKDSGYIAALSIYDAELKGLKMKQRQDNPRFLQFSPKINRNLPGRG